MKRDCSTCERGEPYDMMWLGISKGTSYFKCRETESEMRVDYQIGAAWGSKPCQKWQPRLLAMHPDKQEMEPTTFTVLGIYE